MSKPTKVFLDVLPWDMRARNTDWRYVRHVLPRLVEYEPKLSIVLQQSLRVTVEGNMKALILAIARRVGLQASPWRRETSALAHAELSRSTCDLVFSHREFPLNAGRTPVIWMSAVLDPAMARHYGATEAELQAERKTKRRLFARASAVQVLTDAEARRHSQEFPEIADRFVSVPFFTPHIIACERAQLQKHRRSQTVRLLFVGNHARRKGLEQLLAAFCSLPARVLERAELIIISNFDRSPMHVPAHPRIRVLRGLGSADVLTEMGRAHVLVNVAHFESYGVVFLEAMAQGLACIAPNWEVQRELFDDGRAGMNVACETGAVRTALERLILDEEFRFAMAEAAWMRFQERYTPAIVAAKYADLFGSVVPHRG